MSTPKYKIIYDQIVKFILTDVWPVGSKMKSENELIRVGRIDGPLCDRPIITGPIGSDCLGSCELSISLINTPGDTNLNLVIDIAL